LSDGVVKEAVLRHRAERHQVSEAARQDLQSPVPPVLAKGLSVRNPVTGAVEDASKGSEIAPFAVPFVLLFLMFMVIMMGATPSMQGFVEEKMQRIAEVLLGSVQPFQLMLGKLLGMTAVSLTITAVYLGAAYGAAYYWELTEFVPGTLLLWFFIFQSL